MSTQDPEAVVVDDSHFMRTVITEMLTGGGIEVVDQAKNGREALGVVEDRRPDVVTMDLEMPEMDGLEAVERIMEETPTPILMLSAHTSENADVTFEALERGAVDFFTKPGGEVSTGMAGFEDQLVRKVRSVAGSDVGGQSAPTPITTVRSDAAYVEYPTVVIGASTGGPAVVERVVGELPREADCRVLIVQHMPGEFTGRFADRLDDRSAYDVREADDGDRIRGGEALVAPGGHHLEVGSYRRGRLRVELADDPPVNGVRPAIDVTMESAAREIDDPLVGVILTGMGRDGAAGVEAIAGAGGTAIAQDEATSAVYGMPKRAAETGCVDRVLSDHEVAEGIIETLTEDRS